MIISPMAGAANVSTFSGGDSEVTVEVRDGPFTRISRMERSHYPLVTL